MTMEEMQEKTSYEAFCEGTKDMRASLKVKEMINDRKRKLLEDRLNRIDDNDPMYTIENTLDMAVKPVNVEKCM